MPTKRVEMTKLGAILSVALLLLVETTLGQNQGAGYPRPWIKSGECLDGNVGPLVLGTTPPENPNVIGETVQNVATINDCADVCRNNSECNYFTYYKDKITADNWNVHNCSLVGHNLRHACYHLQKACVLLRHCENFDGSCLNCKTGRRAIYSVAKPPRIVLLNGVVDNRENMIDESAEQYSEDEANYPELLLNQTASCLFSRRLFQAANTDPDKIKARFGSSAIYVHNELFNCGGYSMADARYLNDCQGYKNRGAGAAPWDAPSQKALPHSNGVAFGATVSTARDVAYFLGGYNKDDGFLDSVSRIKPDGTWTSEASLKMNESKSHFCAVYDEVLDSRGERWMYTIGGWNIEYIKSIHRIKVDTGKMIVAPWEMYSTDLSEARSDHACSLVQHGWRRGILVAGGYRTDGAWMSTVEFVDLEQGSLIPMTHFPRLNEARHYNGIGNLDFMPFVFGGWNNGSTSSLEYLDERSESPKWRNAKFNLLIKREKFAYTEVPYDFMPECPKDT